MGFENLPEFRCTPVVYYDFPSSVVARRLEEGDRSLSEVLEAFLQVSLRIELVEYRSSSISLSLKGRLGEGGGEELYWGTVDGFKLLAAKKDWFDSKEKKYFDQGDGECFVTFCLRAGIELKYAIALRSAIIRFMGLGLTEGKNFSYNSYHSEELKACREHFKKKWDWKGIRKLTIDIVEGREPPPDVQLGPWVYPKELLKGLQPYYNDPIVVTLEQRIQQGLFLIQNKEYKKSKKHFQELLELYSKHAGVFYGYMKALFLLSENEPMIQQIELLSQLKNDLAKENLTFPTAYVTELKHLNDEVEIRLRTLKIEFGWQLIYETKFKEAQEHFYELLKAYPNEVHIFYGCAKSRFLHLQSEPVFEQISLLHELKNDLTMKNSSLLNSNVPFIEELKLLYREVNEKIRTLNEEPIKMGTQLITEKKFKEAVQHFRELLKKHPDNLTIIYNHARALLLYSKSAPKVLQIKFLNQVKESLIKVTTLDELYTEAFVSLNEVQARLEYLNQADSLEGYNEVKSSLELPTEQVKENVLQYRKLSELQPNDTETLSEYVESLLLFCQFSTKQQQKILLSQAKKVLEKLTQNDLNTRAFIRLDQVDKILVELDFDTVSDITSFLDISEMHLPSEAKKKVILDYRDCLENHQNDVETLYNLAKSLIEFSENVPKQQQIALLNKGKIHLLKIIELDDLHIEAAVTLEEIEEKLHRLNISSAELTLSSSQIAANKSQTTVINVASEQLNFGEEKGRGGFGVVYEGFYQEARVAIKKLNVSLMNDADFKQFQLEMNIMAKLHFPHIIHFYGACLEPNRYAIVMEYCPSSLYYELHSNNPPDDKRSLQIAIETAKGINYLHNFETCILHRDLKSQNVLIAADGTVKLTDFGLVKIRGTITTMTNDTESSVGTLGWMAPESLGLEGPPEYSTASDVYSFGVLLWEIASRQLPFAGIVSTVVMHRICQGNRDPIPTECTEAIIQLILQCWSLNASERPSVKTIYQTLEKTDRFFQSRLMTRSESTMSYIENTSRSMFSF